MMTLCIFLSSLTCAAPEGVRLGRGCLLTELDVEAAYKQVPVHRDDWPLLGFKWRDSFYSVAGESPRAVYFRFAATFPDDFLFVGRDRD